MNERLLEAIRTLLGPDIRFLHYNDLHVGYSKIDWHRDNVTRSIGLGPDWDEANEPYQLVRAGIYLQSFAESQFRLGFIKGSHRLDKNTSLWKRKFAEKALAWTGALSYLLPMAQTWAAHAEWVATQPGDCILFDPRTLHSGSYITGPKYSMFLAYGVENSHYYNHHNYFMNIRSELRYGELAPELVQMLKDADLYPERLPSYDHIQGAWLPTSVVRNLVAQRTQ